MDLIQPRFHEPLLNLHAHAWIFSRLVMASVAGKQQLSDVVCSSRIGFLLRENDRTTGAAPCIKFCKKLGDSQMETIRKIQTVFGDDAMGITQIKE